MFSASCKWPASMSHAATTWQSDSARNDCVLPGPCQPMPMTPRLIFPDGGVLPSRPRTLLGRMAGKTMAAPAAFKNWRRLMGVLVRDFFMVVDEQGCRLIFEMCVHSSGELPE